MRDDILSGELPFGARLTINGLAKRYETSHMPIREALWRLSGEGIIVDEPNRGARVRFVDEYFVAELLNLRAGIESRLARRTAELATELDIEKMQVIQARLEIFIENKDYEAALIENHNFHNLINDIAENPHSASIVKRHWLLLAAFWRQHGHNEERLAGVVNDHRHLILAFQERDGQTAELLMGAHVAKSKQNLIREIRRNASDKEKQEETGNTARSV